MSSMQPIPLILVTALFCTGALCDPGPDPQPTPTPAPSGGLWAHSQRGPQNVRTLDVVATSDGGALITGVFHEQVTIGPPSGEVTITSAGSGDGFVARLDADGALRWARGFGGPGEDRGVAVASGADDDLWVAGTFSEQALFGAGEPGEQSASSAGALDLFVARFSGDGELRWLSTAGGENDDLVSAVVVDPSGVAYVAGSFWAGITFGAGQPEQLDVLSLGADDPFLARFEEDGSFGWLAQGEGGGAGQAHGLALGADAVFVCGGFNQGLTLGAGQAGETYLTSQAGDLDGWLASYDPSGTLSWARRDGGALPDGCLGVAASADGGLLASGWFRGEATFGAGQDGEVTHSPGGVEDVAWIGRYESDGQLRWLALGEGTDRMGAGAILERADGSVVALGEMGRSATFGDPIQGGIPVMGGDEDEAWIAGFSPDGSPRWARLIGGPGTNTALALNEAPGGALFVAGSFDAEIRFVAADAQSVSLESAGSRDGYLLRFPE